MSNKEKFFAILQDNTYGVLPAPTQAQNITTMPWQRDFATGYIITGSITDE